MLSEVGSMAIQNSARILMSTIRQNSTEDIHALRVVVYSSNAERHLASCMSERFHQISY